MALVATARFDCAAFAKSAQTAPLSAPACCTCFFLKEARRGAEALYGARHSLEQRSCVIK